MAAMTQREIKAAVTVARARWVRDEIVKTQAGAADEDGEI